MAKDVSDEVRERNQPEPAGPEPRGGLIHRHDPDRLARLVDDPLTPAAELEAKAEELEATAATVKQRAAELARAEQARREEEAERKRLDDTSADETRAGLTDIRARAISAMSGRAPADLDTLAAEAEAVIQRRRDAVAPLGINSVVADRVAWAHPIWPLMPWLDSLRREGPFQWQRES